MGIVYAMHDSHLGPVQS